jgi:hypothetical protein
VVYRYRGVAPPSGPVRCVGPCADHFSPLAGEKSIGFCFLDFCHRTHMESSLPSLSRRTALRSGRSTAPPPGVTRGSGLVPDPDSTTAWPSLQSAAARSTAHIQEQEHRKRIEHSLQPAAAPKQQQPTRAADVSLQQAASVHAAPVAAREQRSDPDSTILHSLQQDSSSYKSSTKLEDLDQWAALFQTQLSLTSPAKALVLPSRGGQVRDVMGRAFARDHALSRSCSRSVLRRSSF